MRAELALASAVLIASCGECGSAEVDPGSPAEASETPTGVASGHARSLAEVCELFAAEHECMEGDELYGCEPRSGAEVRSGVIAAHLLEVSAVCMGIDTTSVEIVIEDGGIFEPVGRVVEAFVGRGQMGGDLEVDASFEQLTPGGPPELHVRGRVRHEMMDDCLIYGWAERREGFCGHTSSGWRCALVETAASVDWSCEEDRQGECDGQPSCADARAAPGAAYELSSSFANGRWTLERVSGEVPVRLAALLGTRPLAEWIARPDD